MRRKVLANTVGYLRSSTESVEVGIELVMSTFRSKPLSLLVLVLVERPIISRALDHSIHFQMPALYAIGRLCI